MGNKKRPSAPRSKHPPSIEEAEAPQSPGPDDVIVDPHGNQPVLAELDGQGYAAIKQECERALSCLRRGNHTKALRLMKEALSRHGGEKKRPSHSSALIHRVQATVCVKSAAVMDDNSVKQRYIKTATESARRATQLSPNSVEFAHFYANLLYDSAIDGKEYDEVMRECDRALEIEFPVDPGKESYQEENGGNADARIEHVRNELRSLKQKASISSISTWMKTLGTGEEIRLIPIRRVPEDPMEIRLMQGAKRPNEIKKATKTPEERRKEIEVRVAAARLMQQHHSPEATGERSEKAGGDLSSIERRGSVGDRRKVNRKNASNAERKTRVKAFWQSANYEMKKNLLDIKVSDLKFHTGSSKDSVLATEVLNEALGFAEKNKSWKVWLCCKCYEKFGDAESHMHHIVEEHVGNASTKMREVIPPSPENDWLDMILNCSWKPLDLSLTLNMMDSHKRCQESESVDHITVQTNECSDCVKSDGLLESGPNETNVEPSQVSAHCEDIAMYPPWPVADDPERAKLLEKIHGMLESLIRYKFLAATHLTKVIQFTMDELHTVASGSSLLSSGVDQSPTCIFFLGSSSLRKIVKFLHELSTSWGLNRHVDKIGGTGEASVVSPSDEMKDTINLSDDATLLYLDRDILERGEGATASPSGGLENSDGFLSWVFSDSTSSDELQSWVRKKEEKVKQGLENCQTLTKEFQTLQSLCDRKCDHLNYEEALQAVEDLCLEEGRRRDSFEPGQGMYESVLTMRKNQLEAEPLLDNGKIELEVISSIVKDAVSMNNSQFGFEELYGGGASQLCDLEAGDNEGLRGKELSQQSDRCFEAAIERQKEQVSIEISKVDGRIMRVVSEMRQLEVHLDLIAANDYRQILFTLVKSYLRARLEEMAEKDATEKSDAAREAFLAELAMDLNKGARGSQEKTKEKKKSKDNKKIKDIKDAKILSNNGNHAPRDDSQGHVSHVKSDDDSDGGPSMEEVEELKKAYEIEEKLLQKKLEFQRKHENEARVAAQLLKNKVDVVEEKDLSLHQNSDTQNTTSESLDGKNLLEQSDLSAPDVMDIEVESEPRTLEANKVEKEEEKFQADLKMAVRESLDTFKPRRKKSRSPKSLSPGDRTSGNKAPEAAEESNVYGAGLKNDIGEYNCFLNVIIQSLWHLRRFREEFLTRSVTEHAHVGDPCVVCALYEIFMALNIASNEMQREAVAPTSLRIALSNLYPNSNFFQEAQMNDASEVLVVIFECLHKSFTSAANVPASESNESDNMGSWDCQSEACLVHSLFGMDIFERMKCRSCELESRHLKYTSFFHNINANALRMMKASHPESGFDELLNLVEMNHKLVCDPESTGCGKPNSINHTLARAPHVFTTVVGWQKTCESGDDIAATLAALSSQIDMSVLYRGLDSSCKHRLVSVVCYYGQHYHCFAYNHDHDRWFMYDDKTVKAVGGWSDVLAMCEKGRLQAQVLFFEASE